MEVEDDTGSGGEAEQQTELEQPPEQAEPVAEPAAESAAEPSAEPVAEPVAEPTPPAAAAPLQDGGGSLPGSRSTLRCRPSSKRTPWTRWPRR